MIKPLCQDDRGNVAIIFAFALPILVGVAGAAIDLGRASALRAALQQATDATSASLTDKFMICGDTEPSGTLVARRCKASLDRTPGSKELAQEILAANFMQQGYSERPQIIATPIYNDASGRVEIEARVGYSCIFMKLITKTCEIASEAGAGSPFSARKDGLSLGSVAGEVWLGEIDSPGLPVRLSAEGGTKPYSFAVGTNLPRGLKLNGVEGLITGVPQAEQCINDCSPANLAPIAVSVTDLAGKVSDAPNGVRRQFATATLNLVAIHPLTLTSVNIQTALFTKPKTQWYEAKAKRTGGKPAYLYSCSAIPAGMSCDGGTGLIAGKPDPNQKGEIVQTVTDKRGKSAQTRIRYDFTALPLRPISVDRNELDDVKNTQAVLVAEGGWGKVDIRCEGLPAGLQLRVASSLEHASAVLNVARPEYADAAKFSCRATDEAGQSTPPTFITFVRTRPKSTLMAPPSGRHNGPDPRTN